MSLFVGIVYLVACGHIRSSDSSQAVFRVPLILEPTTLDPTRFEHDQLHLLPFPEVVDPAMRLVIRRTWIRSRPIASSSFTMLSSSRRTMSRSSC